MSHSHTLYFDRLGVVQEGALADLSLVDGNSVESIVTSCYRENNLQEDSQGRRLVGINQGETHE
jgi:hypothetical protein